MKSSCQAPDVLAELALAGSVLPDDAVERHVRECERCRTELNRLREAASALRRMPVSAPASTVDCLDDDDVAVLADGAATDSRALTHASTCGRCRSRLAAVHRLRNDDAVAAELRKLDAPVPETKRRRRAFALPSVATLAAGILAVAILRPANTVTKTSSSVTRDSLHRESAITITTAPRIVGPSASMRDSLIWTSVPHADRYQIKVFDLEGTLVVNELTTDTAFAVPSRLARAVATRYLWKVEARTGWDRWVASDWQEFTIGRRGETR